MSSAEQPPQVPRDAYEFLEAAETYANLATKNAVWVPGKIIVDSQGYEVKVRQSPWRSKAVPMSFTHRETGETHAGTGLPTVIFEVQSSVEAESPLPKLQIRYHLGTAAVDSPERRKLFGLRQPRWQESWDSNLPASDLLVFNYASIHPAAEQEERVEASELVPVSMRHIRRGSLLQFVNREEIQQGQLPLEPLQMLDNHIQLVAPTYAKRIKN